MAELRPLDTLKTRREFAAKRIRDLAKGEWPFVYLSDVLDCLDVRIDTYAEVTKGEALKIADYIDPGDRYERLKARVLGIKGMGDVHVLWDDMDEGGF